MSYTADQLSALQNALARGEKRVTFGDKTVEYRSVSEIKDAIATIQRSLNQSAGQTPARQIRINTHKGF